MTSPQRAALIAVAIAGLAAGITAAVSLPSLASARAAVRTAQAAAAAASQRADSVMRQTDTLRIVASRAAASRDSALHRAATLEARAAVRDTVFRLAAAAAPDTCAAVVVAAEHEIATKDSTIAELHTAVAAASRADTIDAGRADSLRVVLVDLRASTASLSRAAGALSAAVKPSFLDRLKRLAPKPGIGVAAGITPAGQPQLVTGITFGWAF